LPTLIASFTLVSAAVAAPPGTRARGPRADPPPIVPTGPPPAIMPLAEVRPGMVGQALTVFQGTKPEPFQIRVVSVMRNFLPKEDVILIRAEDPRVEQSGIVAGMSGSPVYVDGKLVGAIAYAWSFAKEPLGGVTPIEAMLAERGRPRRREPAELSRGAEPPTSLASALGLADASANGSASSTPRLAPAAVPLAVSGFTARTVAELTDELRPTGLVPMQAGGGRRPGAPPAPGHVEPGSAIGVELVRGDMSIVATGTVTYVNGPEVLAFGHPLFGIGEVYLPLVDAEIHAFMPALSQSFKMSSPLHEVGTLVQDRPACILGNLEQRTSMLPVEVRVTGPGVEPRVFHAEIARNRKLTSLLASTVVSNAIADAEPDVTDMIVTVDSKLGVKGFSPLELRDQVFSADGVSTRALASARGLRAIGDLMFNPFEPIELDRLDVDVLVEYRRDVAEIVAVALPADEVRPGDTVPLRVTLRPYGGTEYVETVPVRIPRSAAGQLVRVEVATGSTVKPDLPQAESLRVYLDNMRKSYAPTSIVVSLETPDDGASLRGRLISGLPASALDTLRTGNQTRRADAYHVADRTVFPAHQLVSGKQELSVLVKSDALGAAR
jgi:SpoIVB peptidase S55